MGCSCADLACPKTGPWGMAALPGLPGHLLHLPGCWEPSTGQTSGRKDSGLVVELVLGHSEQVPVCQPVWAGETSRPSCRRMSGQPLSRNEAGLPEPPVTMKDEGPGSRPGDRGAAGRTRSPAAVQADPQEHTLKRDCDRRRDSDADPCSQPAPFRSWAPSPVRSGPEGGAERLFQVNEGESA